jgi:hypothetical protein
MIQDAAAAVATRNGDPGRAKRAFVKLTMTLCCDIFAGMQSITRRNEPVSGGNAPFAVLGFFPTKTAENSERTADVAAVLAFAKPSAAQDFRGEGGVDD